MVLTLFRLGHSITGANIWPPRKRDLFVYLALLDLFCVLSCLPALPSGPTRTHIQCPQFMCMLAPFRLSCRVEQRRAAAQRRECKYRTMNKRQRKKENTQDGCNPHRPSRSSVFVTTTSLILSFSLTLTGIYFLPLMSLGIHFLTGFPYSLRSVHRSRLNDSPQSSLLLIFPSLISLLPLISRSLARILIHTAPHCTHCFLRLPMTSPFLHFPVHILSF